MTSVAWRGDYSLALNTFSSSMPNRSRDTLCTSARCTCYDKTAAVRRQRHSLANAGNTITPL